MPRHTASEYVSLSACGSKPDSATGNATCNVFCASLARASRDSHDTMQIATSAVIRAVPMRTFSAASTVPRARVRRTPSPPIGKEARESRHAGVDPRIGRRETPANEAFSFGAERAPRREPQPGFAHETATEVERVVDAVDTEERIHRAVGWRRGDAWQQRKRGNQSIACTAEPI